MYRLADQFRQRGKDLADIDRLLEAEVGAETLEQQG
jgi:hypothetical protein